MGRRGTGSYSVGCGGVGRETGAIVGGRWPRQALRQVRAFGVAATGKGQWVLVGVLSCRSGPRLAEVRKAASRRVAVARRS